MNATNKYRLICRDCGHIVESTDAMRCPACGGVLYCEFDLSDRDALSAAIRSATGFWDYLPFFPVRGDKPVTIGEGATPLIAMDRLAKTMGIANAYIKNEAQNPTGTFKDRCMSLAFTKAKEANAAAVVMGSAGNAGAAAAAYAARSGIPCYLFVPAVTPLARIAQSIAYGARLMMVDNGSVTDCIELIDRVRDHYGWMNVTTAYPCNPFQAEAEKAIAYEMAKSMSFSVPDWIVVPVGGGGCLTGIYKGYRDMAALGLTSKMPRMVGVQEDGCCALVKAFEKRAAPMEIRREEQISGIALPIMDAFPLDGAFALQAIYETDGYAVAVTSEELMEAQLLLSSREGIFAEIASSTTVAGLKKLVSGGVIAPQDSVVCVITGSGLKDASVIVDHAKAPLHVPLDPEKLKEIIKATCWSGTEECICV